MPTPSGCGRWSAAGWCRGKLLQVLAGTAYESPIEARSGGRRVSVPLGLAREIFVEDAANG